MTSGGRTLGDAGAAVESESTVPGSGGQGPGAPAGGQGASPAVGGQMPAAVRFGCTLQGLL